MLDPQMACRPVRVQTGGCKDISWTCAKDAFVFAFVFIFDFVFVFVFLFVFDFVFVIVFL